MQKEVAIASWPAYLRGMANMNRIRKGHEAEEQAWKERNPELAKWTPRDPKLRAMMERWAAEEKKERGE